MFKLLGLEKDTPSIVPSDQIIPLHWFEDGFMWKKVIVYTLFVFDDALDPEKLRGALDRLIQRKGYKKLGGRLRKNAEGGVEYHVPAEFNSSRPAVAFSHANHDVNSADHPTASKIPKPTNLKSPAIVGNPEELSELSRPGGAGTTLSLDDYLTTDRPTLGLHITTFRDTTCVSLYWPHVAFDALGKKAIIQGWTLMLQGREDEILTPVGCDTDPLAEFGKHATEPHLLAGRRVGNLGMTGYALRNAIGLVGPKEIRMVCIPAVFWEQMVADVRDELANGATASEHPFVTEGDVLVAWWTRLCCSHLGKDSTTTVAAQNSMSLRKVLGNDLLSPPDHPFISMALGFPTVLLPACDILTKPLSWLALQFRRAIDEQGTREQVEAYAALQREFSPTMRMPIFFGDSGMYNLFYSNWQKAALFDFDFGEATVVPRGGMPLRASYIQCVQDPAFPEGWPISGKDDKGNYWISGFRERGLWAKIKSELEAQARDGKS
ncbi:hypothetical protein G7Z17_g1721 [Cylindrodendrum hubeiense]|uniref:Uncharacterized protein n=1 Tax=Cylindrodendrum hubeiense TaxID=595255 RepID=A0A9P5LF53_9HYPO|nr:hypothetical protein G7Z17_g1721 [Cylindrodendrum hubeiense]